MLRRILVVVVLVLLVAILAPLAWRYWQWGFTSNVQTKDCPACVCETVNTVPIVPEVVPAEESEFNCKAAAEAIGAPPVMVRALCVPAGTGSVSDRLPVGTEVAIGTITFDAEDRVWVLQNFVTPAMANYSFEYTGAELKLFKAPFVLGSELGWAADGTRVPFTICWDVTSDGCVPPTELFPTK